MKISLRGRVTQLIAGGGGTAPPPTQSACPQQGVDNGRIVCRLVVAAEEVVLAAQCQWPYGLLREVIVNAISAVCDVACHARA